MFYHKLAKGILSVGIWSGTQTAGAAISLPIYARLLGAHGFGQYASYQALLLLAAPLGNLGVTALLAKTIAERPDDQAHRAAVIRVAARLNLAGTAILVALAGVTLYPSAVDTSSRIIGVALLLSMLADQAVLFSRGVLYGVHAEARANLPMAVGAALSSAAGIGAALAGLGLPGILLANALAGSLAAGAVLINAGAFFGRASGRPALLAPAQAALVRFSLASGLLSVLAMAMFRIDLPLVQALAGSRQAGLYAAAVKWSEVVWFIPIATQFVMLQSTASFWREDQTERVTALVSRLVRYTVLATAPLIISVAVFAEPILQTYFGPDFAGAAWALRLLAPGVFCYSIARLIMPALQARGALKPLIAAILAATVTDVALNLWLTPAWGANGAALASSVSYTLAALISLRVMQGYGVQPLANLKAGRLLFLCALTAAVTLPTRFLVPQPIIAAAIGSALGLAVFGAGALRLGLVETSEIYRVSLHLPSPLSQPLGSMIQRLEPLLVRLEASRPTV